MLALLLLRLEKDPKPEGSRELRPDGEPSPGEREWEHGEFKIAYRLDERRRVVEIGTMEPTPKSGAAHSERPASSEPPLGARLR